MAFDGIVISKIVHDMKERILGGRIYKIYQPENDEINLMIKNHGNTYRVMLNASATLPLVYFLKENKHNPKTAPNFCMLLRKHIGNGRIVNINQPSFERIIEIEVEHLDDMGDLCKKRLIIEMMGKHSNIIFVNQDRVIVDAIKRIGSQISSVREVLPGHLYQFPPNEKISPFEVNKEYFYNIILNKPMSVEKAIFTSIVGFSKLIATELCYEAKVDGSFSTDSLADNNCEDLWNAFWDLKNRIANAEYQPSIVYQNDHPIEFSVIPLKIYQDLDCQIFDDVSDMLEEFYKKKDIYARMHQKSTDLRKVLSTAIERTSKKYDIQRKQLEDTKNRDKYRIYGELLQTFGYGASLGDDAITVLNYYNNEEVTIPLDIHLTPMENANKYFNKYNKLKRTYEASLKLVEESDRMLQHLLFIQNAMELVNSEEDLYDLKEEMIILGIMKSKSSRKEKEKKSLSKPFHYISKDGIHIYVGKNNLQNDRLTFKFASNKDIWFHAKNMPGSHVIVKIDHLDDVPDQTYEEAARLAAYFSSGRSSSKVEIDYTRRIHLKKPPQSNPGYVIYHTNYSMIAIPDIKDIKEYKEE